MAFQAEVKDSSKFAPVCNPWNYRTTARRTPCDPLDPRQQRRRVGRILRKPCLTSKIGRFPLAP